MRRAALGPLGALLLASACTGSIDDAETTGMPGGRSDTATGDGATSAIGGGTGGPNGTGSMPAVGGATNAPFVAYESVARRVSQAELDNALRDLFGDETRPASRFLLEDEYNPYDNDYTVQQASKALVDGLDILAEDVAKRFVSDPALRSRAVPCTPAGPTDAACFRQVVENLGRRAFRRPITPDEIDAYLTLLDFAAEDVPGVDNDFYTAVELFVRAILQDPEFLYRIEVGTETSTPGVFELDSYEIASRLSFLLWGSTPDEALLAAAANDALRSADARRTEAARLLGDDRARAQVQRFHAMWLGYRAVPHPPDLVTAFNEETSRLIDRVVFDDRADYLDLFLSTDTYLTDFLAEHYGLPAPSGGAGWVDYGDTGRAGILSHGSVLSAFSKFSDTSPTQRGILVRTRLLCQSIGRPPAIVDVDQPPGDADAVCKFDRYKEHREQSSSCAACHDQMDPIGFGLENYDVAGRYREHDDGLPECVIEGEGEVKGVGTFSGPRELANLLVDSGELDACLVKQVFEFATGHTLDGVELRSVEPRVDAFRNAGRAFDQLLLDFVSAEAFALRKEPAP